MQFSVSNVSMWCEDEYRGGVYMCSGDVSEAYYDIVCMKDNH